MDGLVLCMYSLAFHVADIFVPPCEVALPVGILHLCRARPGLGKRTALSPKMRLVQVQGADGKTRASRQMNREGANSHFTARSSPSTGQARLRLLPCDGLPDGTTAVY